MYLFKSICCQIITCIIHYIQYAAQQVHIDTYTEQRQRHVRITGRLSVMYDLHFPPPYPYPHGPSPAQHQP